MSFSLTTGQIRTRSKTVTRRLGWWDILPGEIVNACVKCQGLKKGERIDVLGQIRILSTRMEPLDYITAQDLIREGFPDSTCADFINMFIKANRCGPKTTVNRIEFEYI